MIRQTGDNENEMKEITITYEASAFIASAEPQSLWKTRSFCSQIKPTGRAR